MNAKRKSKKRLRLVNLIAVGMLNVCLTACATSSSSVSAPLTIPETPRCAIPPVPEKLETNKDLVEYTLEVIAEVKRCSNTIEMLRKWIEGVNRNGMGSE